MATLDVIINSRGAQAGARAVNRALGGISGAARRTATGLGKVNRVFQRSAMNANVLAQGLGTVLGVLGVRKVIQYADSWIMVSNRVGLVTESQAELVASTEAVFQVAQRARTSLAGTAELYQRIARSSEQLGLSQAKAVEVTETISKAITISGVSAIAANAAIIQLGQGLASGTLRGDELRSVLEQTPRVARALADGLGVPIGALRELGKQGKLSSEDVIRAIESQRDVIESEFGGISVTFGQAFTKLENSATRFIGRFGDATGVTNDFTSSLVIVSQWLDNVSDDFFDTGFAILQFVRAGVAGFILFGDQVELFVSEVKEGIFGFFNDLDRRIDDNPLLRLIPGFNVGRAIADVLGTEDLAEQQAEETARLRTALEEKQRLLNQGIDAEREAFEKRRAQREAAAGFDLTSVIAGKDTGGPKTFISEGEARAAERLRKELEKLGETLTGRVRTPLEELQVGLDELDRAMAAGVISTVTYDRNVKLLTDTYIEALPSVQAYNDLMEEGRVVTEEVRTPLEIYNQELERLRTLLDANAISQTTYNRASAAAKAELEGAANGTKDFTERMEELAINTAQNIQSAFSDFLFDPTKEGFDRMRTAFADALQKMAADALAQQIFQSLFGGTGSGGMGGFFASLLPAAADGGTFPAGQPVLVGEEGPEVIVPSRRSTVVPNDQMGSMAPVINLSPQITNVVDPQGMTAALQSGAGQRALLNVIQQNPDAIRRVLS